MRNHLKNSAVAAAGVGALVFAGIALAGTAAAAPTGPSTVEQTVSTLRASGYNVVMNRTGGAPMAQCTVTGVRPGQTHSTTDTRGGSSLVTTVTAQTVYVDVAC